MRDPRLIHLWGRLTHCCEKKRESVNQFAKIGKLCSESTVIKKFSIIAEVPTITAFVAAFGAKALKCREWVESTYLNSLHFILPSAFVFLRWFKLAHISIQVCTFHDGWKVHTWWWVESTYLTFHDGWKVHLWHSTMVHQQNIFAATHQRTLTRFSRHTS